MGTGQGPGLRGSAPGGTVQTLLCGEERGWEGKWARELGPGEGTGIWFQNGEIGTGVVIDNGSAG